MDYPSIIPVVDFKLGHLCTLPDQPIGDIEEFVEVFSILRLAGNCCQSLMTNYWLLLFVLYAFSNQIFAILTAYLTQDKTDLVLKQACLGLVVLLRQKETQSFYGFLAFSVSHQVHYSILIEQRDIVSQKQPQKAAFLKNLLQFMLLKEYGKLCLIERRGRLFGLKISLPIPILQLISLDFLNGHFAGPSQLLTFRLHVLIVKVHELGQEVIGQGLCSLMPGEIVIFFVINHLNEELLENVQLIFLELTQGVQDLVGEED